MKTLYDLLDALPNDDAESLRAAFRRAAKATHPDTSYDDPDASLNRRRIVRANTISSDAEQRAAYDRLLARAMREPRWKSRRNIVPDTIHKLTSEAVMVTFVSALSVGGYVLLERLSQASVFQKSAIEDAVDRSAAVAGLSSAGQFDATLRGERDRLEGVPVLNKAIVQTGSAPAANTDSAPEIAIVGRAPDFAVRPDPTAKPTLVVKPDFAAKPDLSVSDAKFYHERGILAYRDGGLNLAIANFDLAIELDPSLADAYIDRGIVLYRLQKFEQAFADVARAKHIETSNRTTSPPPTPQ